MNEVIKNLNKALKSKSSEVEDYELVVNLIFDLIESSKDKMGIMEISYQDLNEFNPLLVACYLRTTCAINEEFASKNDINKRLWNSLYMWTFDKLIQRNENPNDALFGLELFTF